MSHQQEKKKKKKAARHEGVTHFQLIIQMHRLNLNVQATSYLYKMLNTDSTRFSKLILHHSLHNIFCKFNYLWSCLQIFGIQIWTSRVDNIHLRAMTVDNNLEKTVQIHKDNNKRKAMTVPPDLSKNTVRKQYFSGRLSF